MIIYFADRLMNILGHASTSLPEGLTVIEDLKTEDVDTGVAVFECKIPFDKKTRSHAESCTAVGNYILRQHDGENEFYTIMESETDTKTQTVYIYAEDAGLDLINEVVGEYAADKAYPVEHYINEFAYDSGFVVGINEISNLSRKLSWEGEATVTERLASVATQFDGCEISYSFDIEGLEIVNKYINIHKERGKDIGAQLRLNKDVDRIVTTKSIANLATALHCTGGTPEESETPITLEGYKYDDGDFYVSGTRVYSRKALEKWSRYIWKDEPNQLSGNVGHIVKRYSYDTLSQQTLCSRAITELKKLCEIEVNYEVDINKLPDDIRIGDRVNIIDDDGELYLSTRLLKIETSVADQFQTATLGEFLIKESGISQTVVELAAQFAQQAAAAAKAREDVLAAKLAAEAAQEAAAAAESEAETAKTEADAAIQQAAKALADAANANKQVELVQSEVQTAVTKAETAETAAAAAGTEAANAQITAAAAKLDAEQAKKDVAALGNELETVSQKMSAEYARKTDLTNTEASLQSEIEQNAAKIATNVSSIVRIDETANDAKEQAATAQESADAAQEAVDALAVHVTESDTNIVQTSENIILEALKNYTETSDLETFKESVSAQLAVMAENINLNFSKAVEQLEEVNGSLQEQINTITKYFSFSVDGLTIGQIDNPFKVVIDNDRFSMLVNGAEVLWLDPDGKSNIPELNVSRTLNLFGYVIEQDENGNVNCEYVG